MGPLRVIVADLRGGLFRQEAAGGDRDRAVRVADRRQTPRRAFVSLRQQTGSSGVADGGGPRPSSGTALDQGPAVADPGLHRRAGGGSARWHGVGVQEHQEEVMPCEKPAPNPSISTHISKSTHLP